MFRLPRFAGVRKHWKTIGSAVVAGVVLWGALANIWPKLFQISWEPPQGFIRHAMSYLASYLWNPALIWLAMPIAVAWFGYLVVDINRRIDEASRSTHVLEGYADQLRIFVEAKLAEVGKNVADLGHRLDRIDTKFDNLIATTNAAVQSLRQELLVKLAHRSEALSPQPEETQQQVRRRKVLREGKDLLDAMAMNDGDAFLKGPG